MLIFILSSYQVSTLGVLKYINGKLFLRDIIECDKAGENLFGSFHVRPTNLFTLCLQLHKVKRCVSLRVGFEPTTSAILE